MSKRKKSVQKFTPGVFSPQTAREIFQRANTELHTIRVSTPILVIIQRLTTDQEFRRKVTNLF